MRVIRFIDDAGREWLGEDTGDGTARILGSELLVELHHTNHQARIAKLLAPIVPIDIICIGRNYLALDLGREDAAPDDQREEGADGARRGADDATLEVFLKPSTALQHPDQPILIPHFDGLDPQLDCEGELVVIIARDAHNINEADALDHVLGYTIANDVTARTFQTLSGGGPPLWMRGKGFDTFCPLGPCIVTRDEIPDPQNLSIRTIINGKVVRDGHTSQMIRSVPQIIATLSRHMTLRRGAVILTGAPPTSHATPTVLPDAMISIEIDRLGCLSNTVAAARLESMPP
jgi:2-keto-4-pentenoate hydratase/2-oxohepta-3-ene-1,7-dioic acid hydratase in catechol pathway